MGSQISKIKFDKILKVIDHNNENLKIKKPYSHTIYYYGGRQTTINLTKKEENDFQIKYKYSKLYEKIKKIQYYDIQCIPFYDIIKNNDTIKHSIKIVYNNNDNMDNLILNQEQYDFFVEMYNKLNPYPHPIPTRIPIS
jgi:hypothetical protein